MLVRSQGVRIYVRLGRVTYEKAQQRLAAEVEAAVTIGDREAKTAALGVGHAQLP